MPKRIAVPMKNRRIAEALNPIRRSTRRGLLALLALAFCASACGTSAASLSHTAQQRRDTLIKQGLAAQSVGDATTAAAAYNAALVIDKTSAIAHYDLGDVQQLDLGKTVDAVANYKLALATEPNLAPALFNLAILETAHDPKAAAISYRRLIALDKSDAAAIWNLGYVLVALGQTKAGEAEVARALVLDPALSSRAASTPLG